MITRGARASAAKAGAELIPVLSVPSAAGLERITEVAESRGLRVAVDEVFPFQALGAAIEHAQSGRAKGRVVLERS